MNRFWAKFTTRFGLALVGVTAATAITAAARAELPSPTFEIGGQFSQPTPNGGTADPDRIRSYLTGTSRATDTLGTETEVGWDAQVRGWLEWSNTSQYEGSSEAQIRNLSVHASQGRGRLEVGFQTFAWGETFGFPIADIVNPRDYRDPLLAIESDWTKLPVAAVQLQWLFGSTTLQAIFVPVNRPDLFPTRAGFFVNTEDPQTSVPRTEGGLRITHIFDSGVDLGAFAYRHRARGGMTEFNPETGQFTSPTDAVTSTGITASASSGDWVFRGDNVAHWGQPIVPLGYLSTLASDPRLPRGDQFESIWGADVNFGSDLTLGGQYQLRVDRTDLTSHSQQWLGGQLRGHLDGGAWEPALFVFIGAGNADRWIQPAITWNPGSLSFTLRYDYVLASSDFGEGLLGGLGSASRAWLSAAYRF